MAMPVIGPGHPRFVDLTSQRFGRLVVESYAGRHARFHRWKCQCDCGRTITTCGAALRNGNTSSCGCLRVERAIKATTKHGSARRKKRSPEYEAWQNMIARCERTLFPQYADYGGRGIRVCNRWRNGEDGLSGFECFLSDMGNRPSAKHSLDRKDNTGHYEPGNCRWATRSEQQRNRRNNVVVVVNGHDMILADALKFIGASRCKYDARIKAGMTPQQVIDACQTQTQPD